jgi:AcrR family transcriptional regulator
VQVSEVQRTRILEAMVRVVAEHGVGSATVSRVVRRACVSRRTFYELFTSSEDCFLAAFEDALSRASRIATEAAAAAAVTASSQGWREQVRTGLGALLWFFDDEPLSGSLLIVDALGAGPVVLERRTRMLGDLAAIVDRGRLEGRSGTSSSPPPPSLTAEGIVGAVLAVIHARMLVEDQQQQQQQQPLVELLGPLMAMIVLPYLGRAASAKELARPIPQISRTSGVSRARRRFASTDPLEGLSMRLTYRTLMVLSAIAATPGASNRQVAEAAGVHDQGQISKLLGRLEKLGLLQNTGNGQPQGEPNAWTLTTRGQDVQHTLTAGR